MLDTIQIRKTGYPVRYTFTEFLKRYIIVLPEDKRNELASSNWAPHKKCDYIMKELQMGEGEYAIGKSKLFIRDMPADRLENRFSAIQAFRLRKIKAAIRQQQRGICEDARLAAIEHKKEDEKLGLTDETIVDPLQTPTALGIEEVTIAPVASADAQMDASQVKKLRLKERMRTMRRKVDADVENQTAQESRRFTMASVQPIKKLLAGQQVQLVYDRTNPDASAPVDIARLFITDEGETKKVSFSGVRCETELQKLFKTIFPTHQFPMPFPKVYLRDPTSGVSYEVTDYGEISEGCEVRLNRPVTNVALKLEELNQKLERGFDVVKDHMRLLSTGEQGAVVARSQQTLFSPSGSPKGRPGLSLAELKEQKYQLQQLRRDVAICKQITRDEHESYKKELDEEIKKVLQNMALSMTPLQVKRFQLQKSKVDILRVGKEVESEVKDFELLVKDIHLDMTKRKVRPSEAVHDAISTRFCAFEAKFNAANKKYDQTIDRFKKLWAQEEADIKAEKDVLSVDTNNLLCDVEEIYDRIVDMIEEIQFCRAKKEFDVPIIMAASDVDEAVEGLMDEISFTRVNNEARVRAVEEMEQKMKKRKEFEREADPVVRFAKDLNMGKVNLKKTGGFEELERARKRKEKELGLLGQVQ
ncbi:uncharacterized protein LOC135146232 isoform X2 [Zophobas morio]